MYQSLGNRGIQILHPSLETTNIFNSISY